MSKLAISVCSFTAGICCTLLAVGHGAATYAASSASSQTYSGFTVNTNGLAPDAFNVDPRAIPKYISLKEAVTATRSAVSIGFAETSPQTLDGLECDKCTFNGNVLRYSGGPFILKDVTFTKAPQLVLSGAAANTVALLGLLNGLGAGIQEPSPTANKPIQKKIAPPAKPASSWGLTPPFIGGSL